MQTFLPVSKFPGMLCYEYSCCRSPNVLPLLAVVAGFKQKCDHAALRVPAALLDCSYELSAERTVLA
jgi:hypothetical protein